MIALAPNSKEPRRGSRGYRNSTTDYSEIRTLWSETPKANVGIVTGTPSGIVIVDIDVKDGKKGEESALALDLPETLEASTPSGGRHLYYQYPTSSAKVGRSINWRPGIDLLGDGGYVVASPSVTDKGEYRWANNLEPAPFPERLLAPRCDERGSGADGRRENGVIPEGTRDDALFRKGCALRSQGYDEKEILRELLEINRELCDPPLDETQVEEKATQAAKYPRGLTEEEWSTKVGELAGLQEIVYAQRRKAEAGALGVSVKLLDGRVAAQRKANEDVGDRKLVADVEPWDEPVEGPDLVAGIRAKLKTYLDLSDGADLVIALWVLHAWTIDVSHVSPILAITSPDKRCGKTTLLKLLNRLVRRPLIAANISPAAVFRVIERSAPTLLIDEADSFLKDNEPLRNVLNASHDRENAFVIRCHGETNEPERFCVYSAKAIAVIGRMHETLMDRSIEIVMQRTTNKSLPKLRSSNRASFEALQRQCARWAEDHMDEASKADPQLPEHIAHRAEDNWFELFRMATIAGVAEDALSVIKKWLEDDKELGINEQLLSDIKQVYEESGSEFLSSDALCYALSNMVDRPWSEWSRGKPISSRKLASRLKPYGIQPEQTRQDQRVVRGYVRAGFLSTWGRYLDQQTVTPVTIEKNQAVTPFRKRDNAHAVSQFRSAKKAPKSKV